MNREERLNFLKNISEVDGISGAENEVAKLVKRELSDVADHFEYDNLGSIIAYKKGEEGEPTVLICGHMDEVGFLVSRIEDSGLLRLAPIGGWWNPSSQKLASADCGWTVHDGKRLIGAFLFDWKNPHPQDPIRSVTLCSYGKTVIGLLGLTAEQIR